MCVTVEVRVSVVYTLFYKTTTLSLSLSLSLSGCYFSFEAHLLEDNMTLSRMNYTVFVPRDAKVITSKMFLPKNIDLYIF